MDQHSRFHSPQSFGAFNQPPPAPQQGQRSFFPVRNVAPPRHPLPMPTNTSVRPPQLPPQDDDLRKLIDQTADYIAQHGPESEEETRRINYGNPRFQFLFGGEHSEYYRCRLMSAVRNLHGPAAFSQPPPFVPRSAEPIPPRFPPPPIFNLETARSQVEALRKKLTDSHANLLAQYNSMNSSREDKISAVVKQAEKDRTFAVLQKVNLNIEPLNVLLKQLEDSCSKEVIQTCKNWIFENCDSDQLREVVLSYLLFRVKEDDTSDTFKLHLLYLVNDWAIYAQRKRLENVRQCLSRYVPQMYAFAALSREDKPSTVIDKLEKLLAVWEKSKTFDDNTLKQVKNPTQVKANYKLTLYSETQKADREVSARVFADYGIYEQQHNEFQKHALVQIEALEKQIADFEANGCVEPPPVTAVNQVTVPVAICPPSSSIVSSSSDVQRRSRFDQKSVEPPTTNNHQVNSPSFNTPPPSTSRWNVMPPDAPGGFFNPPPATPEVTGGFFNTPSTVTNRVPPPQVAPMPLRDIILPHNHSHSPAPASAPTFSNGVQREENSHNSRHKHHFELSAGDMMTGVPDNALTYEPVDPDAVHQWDSANAQPSQEVIAALDQFYDTHISPDNPRDADGWEKLGLQDYFTMKEEHRRKLLEELEKEGESIEDIITNKFILERDNPEQAERERIENERASELGNIREASSSQSPRNSPDNDSSSSRQSRNNHFSEKSPQRRSRTRSPSPCERPSFGGPQRSSLFDNHNNGSSVEDGNIGARMMARMGWNGRGLGSSGA
ncbi:hypothetical protein QR680_001256 [Steinernema hermaphroditum]|uniref:SURP motif domain-containing protein n=1 Tax=Steinernema hermaphroditum TaxID=289476 RepID=A0AA39LFM8_9BILA|nr:hypothetical protein QR680_001256 [Steinernema hermaphroditum]